MNKNKFLSGKVAAYPHVVWSVLFIVFPLIFVIYFAFTTPGGAFTLENIYALGDHKETFVLSVSLSLIATFFCFIVGYPLAYLLAQVEPKKQRILIMLLMLPMWTNLLIRTYSMMALMDDAGIINSLLKALNLGTVRMIGTKAAVVFGMAYDFFPYMVLPIFTSISKIDKRVIEAAADLGSNPLRVMTKVVLPLSASGIISGITMVFVPSISTFYISQKLGGGTFDLLGDAIERQFQNVNTYNVGAAISLVMMILVLTSLWVMNRFTDSEEREVRE
ncbi:MAG: ABC transporter permease [Ruminococcaceae bacterium]|nr:ABC transporter permease [Oscillospiraceae bacterium]